MTDADALKAKGNAAFSAKNFDEAVEHFTAAIAVAPQNHVLYSNRSACYASMGDYATALADAEKTIELNPSWPKGYSRKGAALEGLNRPSEAVETYATGLTHDSANAALLAAKERVEGMLAAGPAPGGMGDIFAPFQDPHLLAKLAMNPKTSQFVAQPDFVAKVKEIQANPQSIQGHLQDPRMMAVFQVVLEESMGSNVKFTTPEDAAKDMETMPTEPTPAPAPEKKPEPAKPAELSAEEQEKKEKKEKGDALKLEGNALYKARNFEPALAKYAEAIEANPVEMSYHLNTAAVYMEMGRFEDCVAACHRAIDTGRAARADYKHIAKAFLRIGNAHFKQQQWEDAIKAYDKSLTESYTDEANSKNKQAKAKLREAEAAAYLDEGKALEAKEAGNTFFKAGNFVEAMKQYEESIKRNPNSAPVYSNLAACLGKLGDFPRAVAMADKCLELDPTFVKAYIRKGGFQVYLKEHHKAIKSFEKALELEPNSSEAREGLLKTRQTMYSSTDSEERAKHAMADPEIQAILMDPVMQQVLKDCTSDPAAAQKHFANPEIAGKLQKLIDSGVIGTK